MLVPAAFTMASVRGQAGLNTKPHQPRGLRRAGAGQRFGNGASAALASIALSLVSIHARAEAGADSTPSIPATEPRLPPAAASPESEQSQLEQATPAIPKQTQQAEENRTPVVVSSSSAASLAAPNTIELSPPVPPPPATGAEAPAVLAAPLAPPALANHPGAASAPATAASGAAAYVAPARDLAAETAALDEEELVRFGLKLDGGVPDGIGASVVVRPWRWLRLSAGGGTNLFAPGINGGLALVPFDFWITPVLAVEGGHYFEGDASKAIAAVTGTQPEAVVLKRIGYDYANAHLGLEFGSRRFTFFLHGGWTYVRAALHAQQDAKTQNITLVDDIIVSGWAAPSAKLGFIYYIF